MGLDAERRMEVRLTVISCRPIHVPSRDPLSVAAAAPAPNPLGQVAPARHRHRHRCAPNPCKWCAPNCDPGMAVEEFEECTRPSRLAEQEFRIN